MKSKHVYAGVKTLEVLEGADNYNAWIASRILPYIQSPALEIGAGTGNISDFLSSVEDLTLTDIDESLVEHLKERFKGKKNVSSEVFDISKTLHKISNKFKTVYSVNVLEHIEDDVLALRNMNRLLEKDGRVVLLVPAKKIAYKTLDKHLGHFRRYEKKDLEKKIKDAGFNVEYIGYFNTVGLASWILRDLISAGHHAHLKPSQVKLFDAIVPVLRRIEPKSNLPFGISLIAVGKKI
jgi:SAM-dependent methyltransferase